jgi:hypothetical protein
MDIKDYLQEYVKSTALKLGGEEAISEVSGGGLEGLVSFVGPIDGYAGDTTTLEESEGNRLLFATDQSNDMFLFANNINFFKPMPGGGIQLPNSVSVLANSGITLNSTDSIDLKVEGTGFLGNTGAVSLVVQGNGQIPAPLHGFTVDNGNVVMRQNGGSTNGSVISMGGSQNMTISTGFLNQRSNSGMVISSNPPTTILGGIAIKNANNTPGHITRIILGNEPAQDQFGGAPLPKSPAGLPFGAIWVDGTGASASLRIVMPE